MTHDIACAIELAMNANVPLRRMLLVVSEEAAREVTWERLYYYGVAVVVDAECGRPFEIVGI